MNQPLNQSASRFAAHEMIAMNEALMTKAANVEILSFLSHQVQDPQLQNMLQQHAQVIHNNYMQGVSLLQGQGMATPSMNASIGQVQSTTLNAQPKLGLRNPTMPAPNMQVQTPSERAICTMVLNMHKFGAVGWTTLALECTNPQFRTFLMNGAGLCDRMAYEIWAFMNQKGYYQVPTLQENTTQTMIQAYQVPAQGPHMPQQQGLNHYQ